MLSLSAVVVFSFRWFIPFCVVERGIRTQTHTYYRFLEAFLSLAPFDFMCGSSYAAHDNAFVLESLPNDFIPIYVYYFRLFFIFDFFFFFFSRELVLSWNPYHVSDSLVLEAIRCYQHSTQLNTEWFALNAINEMKQLWATSKKCGDYYIPVVQRRGGNEQQEPKTPKRND